MKQLFICKEHHHVLLPWSRVRRTSGDLNLLTFDHHTDTKGAFEDYLYHHNRENLKSLVEHIDINGDNSIQDAIKNLKNDEHIDTAIRCGILRKAFSVSYNGSFNHPPSNEYTNIFKNIESEFQYRMGKLSLPEKLTYPNSSLYIVGTSDILDDENSISDDFLSSILSEIKIMSNIDIMRTEYIVDVDLDYFHSYNALNRNDIKIFGDILSQATAITIATEPDFAYHGINPEIILKWVISLAKQKVGDNLEIVNLR